MKYKTWWWISWQTGRTTYRLQEVLPAGALDEPEGVYIAIHGRECVGKTRAALYGTRLQYNRYVSGCCKNRKIGVMKI
jgi:hypothetical protein